MRVTLRNKHRRLGWSTSESGVPERKGNKHLKEGVNTRVKYCWQFKLEAEFITALRNGRSWVPLTRAVSGEGREHKPTWDVFRKRQKRRGERA